MATSSEVKSALDAIAEEIASQRAVLEKAQLNASGASAVLADLPTLYADVVTTVQGYGTTNAFEALSKAEMAKLAAEYNALKASADEIAAVTI